MLRRRARVGRFAARLRFRRGTALRRRIDVAHRRLRRRLGRRGGRTVQMHALHGLLQFLRDVAHIG